MIKSFQTWIRYIFLEKHTEKYLPEIHNGILLSYKKNTFESVLIRWMKLEPIIQSEGSQKEKHQ